MYNIKCVSITESGQVAESVLESYFSLDVANLALESLKAIMPQDELWIEHTETEE